MPRFAAPGDSGVAVDAIPAAGRGSTIARVAHIVPTDRIAYLLLGVRLKKLQAAGFDITVICGRGSDTDSEWSPFGDDLRALGLRVLNIPFAREIAPLTDLRCAWSMYRCLRRERFDIIHSHNPKGGLVAPAIGRLARGPAVLHTVHGFLFNEDTRGLRDVAAHAAERWTAACCDHLLFQSREDFDYASRHGFKAEGRLHLIGNGIDPVRFDPVRLPDARRLVRSELGWTESDLVVGMVGRTVLEKGFVEFFEMADRLARDFQTARFLVVAISEQDQSDAVDLQRLIAAKGLQDRCHVLQQRHDMPELYLAMDIAVLPSHREGISRSLMEAAAMERPLVASDIRGCREIVDSGRTGRLFPVRNADALTAAVHGLLSDEPMRESMGRAGRRRVLERFTEEATSRRIATCYEEILSRRGNGARERSEAPV